MRIRAPHLGIAPPVALIGGGALLVANLLRLAIPSGRVSGLDAVEAALVLVTYLVLAFGLPGSEGSPRSGGAFGSRRAVRVLLVASGVLGVLVALEVPFGTVDESTISSTGFRVYGSVTMAADLISLVLLVFAARLATVSPGVRRDAARGLSGLAYAALVVLAVDVVFSVFFTTVFSPEQLQSWAWILLWIARLQFVVGIAVGLWFAWPWLGPRLHTLRRVSARAYRRYVDSTP